MSDQVREHVLSCLEDVKLDLEDLKQHSSAVVVAQAVEVINELSSRLDEVSKELAATKGGPISCEAHGWSGDDNCAYCRAEDAEGRLHTALDAVQWVVSDMGYCPPELAVQHGVVWHAKLSALIAQLAEHDASNVGAAGSSPAERSTCTNCDGAGFVGDFYPGGLNYPCPDCNKPPVVERGSTSSCGAMFPPGQFAVQQCTLPKGHAGEHANNVKGL